MRVALTNRFGPLEYPEGELPKAWVANVGREVPVTTQNGKVVGKARVLAVRQAGIEVTIEIGMDDDGELAKAIRGKVWPEMSMAPAPEPLTVTGWESERMHEEPWIG